MVLAIILLSLAACNNSESKNMLKVESPAPQDTGTKSGSKIEDKVFIAGVVDKKTKLYYSHEKGTLYLETPEKSYDYKCGEVDDVYLTEDATQIVYTWGFSCFVIDIGEGVKVNLLTKLGIDEKLFSAHDFSLCGNTAVVYIYAIDDNPSNSKYILVDLTTYKQYDINFPPEIKTSKIRKPIAYKDNQIMTTFQNENEWHSNLVIFNTDGEISKKLEKLDKLGYDINFGKFSPDARFMLCNYGSTPSDLILYDLKKNKGYDIIHPSLKNGLLKSTGKSTGWINNDKFYYESFDFEGQERITERHEVDVNKYLETITSN